MMAEYKDIAVFAEVREGKLVPISAEGLGIGHQLADDSGQTLTAVLVGSGVTAAAQEAIAGGADRVFTVDNPLLKDYQGDAYITVMEQVVNQIMPQIIILGQTDIGRDLAPRLAFKLGTAANLDCIELAIDADSKRLLQTKPVYGGNANAVYIFHQFGQPCLPLFRVHIHADRIQMHVSVAGVPAYNHRHPVLVRYLLYLADEPGYLAAGDDHVQCLYGSAFLNGGINPLSGFQKLSLCPFAGRHHSLDSLVPPAYIFDLTEVVMYFLVRFPVHYHH